MKESILKKYRAEIIILYVFTAVLLTVAAVYDLKIDIAVSNTSSAFAGFLADYGELPAAFLPTIAAAVLMKCFTKKWLKIIAGAAVVGIGVTFGQFLTDGFLDGNDYKDIIGAAIGVVIGIGVLVAFRFVKISEDKKKPLIIVTLLGIAALLLQNEAITGLKHLWGRVRFRDLDEAHTLFKPWYSINTAVGGHSFPSSHTAKAGMSYLVMLLPCVFEKLRKNHFVLFIIAFAYTYTVAFTRLMVGAHYLSDIAVGSAISFTVTLIAVFAYEKISAKVIK